MSLQDLSLPIDVPWKLIATSEDMLAGHANPFPHAMWKSSMAVFAFDPDLSDLPDEFPDRELSFLKVVCSITSYTPPCEPCPPPPKPFNIGEDFGSNYERALADWRRADAECRKLHQRTYPCSGALVQVAVYPKEDETTDVAKLAYFAAFEPKKRELIEVATESGESMTQSKSAANIRKGVTSTDTMEDLNVFTGANLNVGVAGVSAGAGVTGQWGTIKKSATEHVDTTNTDASREAREGSSHTTSLSQLYHLLNSYHLGTNRAIFFLQSRPHTVHQKGQFTFIDGPEEIEGVQELFLVLSRPKGIPLDSYCVDALLYTAHLDGERLEALLREPKTAESPWQELWLGYQIPKKDDTWPTLGDLVLGAEILFGVPLGPDPVTIAAAATSTVGAEVGGRIGDAISTWIYRDPDKNVPSQAALIPPPTIKPLLYMVPCEPGWRIDRSRGLGGYDLWENPGSTTADPLGGTEGKAKPQVFIDILSQNSSDNPLAYLPDSVLVARVYVWPGSDSTPAWYHGRLKTYFIRDDAPTEQRTVGMFITVRGTSTCGGSLFANLSPDSAITLPAPIIKDSEIHPPNVAPWQGIRELDASAAGGSLGAQGTGSSAPPTPPINSAKPSGLDPLAISLARAKMSNAVGDLVRQQLNAALACLPQRKDRMSSIQFAETDLVFNRMAGAVLGTEVGRLAADQKADPHLAEYVARHAALRHTVASAEPFAVTALRAAVAKRAAATKPSTTSRKTAAKQTPGATLNAGRDALPGSATRFRPTADYTMLTLASPDLSAADRQTLANGGIVSGLDLVGTTATDLARRLRVSESDARTLRRRALGLNKPG